MNSYVLNTAKIVANHMVGGLSKPKNIDKNSIC